MSGPKVSDFEPYDEFEMPPFMGIDYVPSDELKTDGYCVEAKYYTIRHVPSYLRRDPGPGHATATPDARVTGPAVESPTPAPDPSTGLVWDEWVCDQCGHYWPLDQAPTQDAIDLAWRRDQALRFCDEDCLTDYSESLGTQP